VQEFKTFKKNAEQALQRLLNEQLPVKLTEDYELVEYVSLGIARVKGPNGTYSVSKTHCTCKAQTHRGHDPYYRCKHQTLLETLTDD